MAIELGLIHKEARSSQWSGIEYAERIGIASLAAVEAERNWNPDRGQLSTVTTTYIRNALRNEAAKHKTRMKYDGVQVSCLLPSQIPAATLPETESVVVFRDQLTKLPTDARIVASMLLRSKDTKHALRDTKALLKNKGWSVRRVQSAVNEVREVLK
jgi:hypothetical protein